MRVVGILFAEDHEAVFSLGDSQLVSLDPGEWLEGRSGRPPTVGAMAIHGIDEFVRHGVFDGAAIAFAGKHAADCRFMVCHELLPRRSVMRVGRRCSSLI